MSDKAFDLIVIGSGPAGYIAAIRAAQLGMKTACVEKDKTLGGTCLNVGCIPSKALLDSSEKFHQAQHAFKKHGIDLPNVQLNLTQMMKRKAGIVDQLTKGVEYLFKKNKITRFQGVGKLVDGGETKKVQVGSDTLTAPKVLLATGSVPVELPFLKFDGKNILSSTEALSLPEVPNHLVVIGGGVIGLELGSVWLRLGAKVTVVEFADQLLPRSDRQIAKEVEKSLKKQGMNFHFGTKCTGADGTPLTVHAESIKDGKKVELICDKVLVATGRRAYSDGLGLAEVGVKMDQQGRVEIDNHYQTSVPGVFAIGDLVRGPMLAHKGEEEGVAAVELIAGQAGHVDYDLIPDVIYIWPELASVGLTEEAAKEKGIEVRKGVFPFAANGRAKAMEESEGMVKIVADAKTDRVLGVHIFGPNASDLIAESVSVMEFGGSAEDIARTCHAHPTLSETVKEAALDVAGRKLNL